MSAREERLARNLLDPASALPEGLFDRPGRFAIHRNTVTASLIEALCTGFPVITRLLGDGVMKDLALRFLRAHPPSSPLLMLYGEGFPEFLEADTRLADLGYLGDVARLDLALRHAYHAADAPPLPAQQLAALPPDRLAEVHLDLAPALRLLRSPWPIFDIWRFNTETNAPAPRAVAQDVLITRPAYDPLPQPLPPGGAGFVAALLQGAPLGEAEDRARAEAADVDLAALFTLLLQGGAIIGASLT
ncbi:HvfC/BufC N-terminal domain-containing protein [Pseudodonghicola xiamenensis]|uniref:Putative DNA-binding domain-containing protein n=1 Tax=Pseudodonghicola xiamenensis TaxID=337702 RepID=A0A8J3MCF3_9RHOB|nr:DNA-binding domain-containing protein [Pseudodonghicola xiamenensis]GHG91298.1 hypothetical protein GCM10010961_22430 [Pseudodonghicola xiamenensis]